MESSVITRLYGHLISSITPISEIPSGDAPRNEYLGFCTNPNSWTRIPFRSSYNFVATGSNITPHFRNTDAMSYSGSGSYPHFFSYILFGSVFLPNLSMAKASPKSLAVIIPFRISYHSRERCSTKGTLFNSCSLQRYPRILSTRDATL